ncbi:MAG: hypothetical protein HY898_36395 [Deltaproteobacteria bacterium]|nr:hypothetical protein [Deltaproteobacteria bacterium]
MMDPRRMLQGDADDVERTLLRSASEDEPPEGSEQALLAALAILPAATTAASAGVVAAGGGGALGSATGSVAAAAARLGGWSLVRWVGVGVLAGSATLGGVRVLSGPASRDLNSASSRPIPVGSALRPVRPAPAPVAQGEAEDAAVVEPAPSAKRVDKTPPASADPPASAPVSADLSLAAEVAALDRARKALAADDPGSALRIIEEQPRGHTEGVLKPETEVVRIEALLKSGNRQAGVELARRFLAKYPDHPLQGRVRSLLNQASVESVSKPEGAKP